MDRPHHLPPLLLLLFTQDYHQFQKNPHLHQFSHLLHPIRQGGLSDRLAGGSLDATMIFVLSLSLR